MLKRRLQRLVRVYTCHKVKLLEISCRGSNHTITRTHNLVHGLAVSSEQNNFNILIKIVQFGLFYISSQEKLRRHNNSFLKI